MVTSHQEPLAGVVLDKFPVVGSRHSHYTVDLHVVKLDWFSYYEKKSAMLTC